MGWFKRTASGAVGLAALTVVATAQAGCTKVQARTPTATPPPPALSTPPPPAPLIIPVQFADPLPATAPEPPATASRPTTVVPRPPADRTTPVPPPPASVPETPPPALRTTVNVTEIETKAKDLIDNAQRDLSRVSYKTLSKDARVQFGYAEEYIRRARTALENKNYLLASEMAGKAAVMANLLLKGH